jgi:DNA polymerase III delta prime subunit
MASTNKATEEDTGLDTKYRPSNLDEIIGHDGTVTRLRGIIEEKKWPKAILFTGPTSVGKTTLARAFATSILGKRAEGHPDFMELNASDSRSIDDMRELIGLSKLRPTSGIRRFILVDEAQGLLSTPASVAAILKPVETPPKTTTWIFGSMDPEKFQSTQNGKALANRCIQFALQPPSADDLFTYGKRIVKGEGVTFFMRSLANLIQSAIQFHSGLPKAERPAKLAAEHMSSILQSSQTEDDFTIIKILAAVYAQKFSSAQKEILNLKDGFGSINKMLNTNWFILNHIVLKGARHPKVWGNKNSFELVKVFETIVEQKGPANVTEQVRLLGFVQDALTQLKFKAQAFALPEQMAISSTVFNVIQTLKAEIK